jgi:hypothetical protein
LKTLFSFLWDFDLDAEASHKGLTLNLTSSPGFPRRITNGLPTRWKIGQFRHRGMRLSSKSHFSNGSGLSPLGLDRFMNGWKTSLIRDDR